MPITAEDRARLAEIAAEALDSIEEVYGAEGATLGDAVLVFDVVMDEPDEDGDFTNQFFTRTTDGCRSSTAVGLLAQGIAVLSGGERLG